MGAGPLVVTYPLTGRSRAVVEEELGGTTQAIYLVDLAPAARAHALGRAGAVLSHDTSKELRPDEIPLIRNAQLLSANRMPRGGVCGILGFGNVGVATARLMRAFGMAAAVVSFSIIRSSAPGATSTRCGRMPATTPSAPPSCSAVPNSTCRRRIFVSNKKLRPPRDVPATFCCDQAADGEGDAQWLFHQRPIWLIHSQPQIDGPRTASRCW